MIKNLIARIKRLITKHSAPPLVDFIPFDCTCGKRSFVESLTQTVTQNIPCVHCGKLWRLDLKDYPLAKSWKPPYFQSSFPESQ